MGGEPELSEARPRGSRWLATALVVGTLLHAWALLSDPYPFASIDGWFYRRQYRPVEPLWVVLIVALICVLGAMSARLRSTRLVTATFVVGALALLLLWAGSSGDAAQRLRGRMEFGAQRQYSRVAVRDDEPLSRIISDYESVLIENDWHVQRTKPPGTQLAYQSLYRLSRAVPGGVEGEELDRLYSVGAIVLPFVAALVVLPLMALGRRAWGEWSARAAAILLLCIPNWALGFVTLDQALYPLLFTAAVLGVWWSLERRSVGLGVLAGIGLFVSVFFSFSLMALMPATGALFLAYGRLNVRSALGAAGGVIAGVGVAMLVFDLALGYDFLHRYGSAIETHAAFKGVEWTPFARLRWGVGNLFEFATWLGFPVVLLASISAARSTARFLRGKSFLKADVLPLVLTAVLVSLFWFGKTKGEVGRLWIFVVPLVALVASSECRRGQAGLRSRMALVVGLQLTTVYLVRRYQDFF